MPLRTIKFIFKFLTICVGIIEAVCRFILGLRSQDVIIFGLGLVVISTAMQMVINRYSRKNNRMLQTRNSSRNLRNSGNSKIDGCKDINETLLEMAKQLKTVLPTERRPSLGRRVFSLFSRCCIVLIRFVLPLFGILQSGTFGSVFILLGAIVNLFPEKLFSPFLPRGKALSSVPISIPQRYRFRNLDFLSRLNLLEGLVPQIRLIPYNGNLLCLTLLQASKNHYWDEKDEFRQCRRMIANFPNQNLFLKWFLKWNLSSHQVSELIEAHAAEALTYMKPARTYSEVLDVLRALDNLPYLHFQFQEVFHELTTISALSNPAVAAPLKLVYEQNRTYFAFFAAIDHSCWSILEKLPGRPLRPLRPSRLHQLRSGVNRLKDSREQRLTPLSPKFSLEKVTFSIPVIQIHFSPFCTPVCVGPQKLATYVYWDRGSSQSFVSPTVLQALNLTPRNAKEQGRLQMVGLHKQTFISHAVTLELTMPTFNQKFSLEFMVIDSGVAPIVLGVDFWDQL